VWRQRSKGAETQRSRGLADHFLCSNVRQPRHGRLACAGTESRMFHLSGAPGDDSCLRNEGVADG
jgi:hypothetical protein